MNIYQKIQELNPNSEIYIYTIVSGNCCGAKLLASGSNIICTTGTADLLIENFPLLSTFLESGTYTVQDEKVYVEKVGRGTKIIICGGGHVSMPVITIGRMIGCHVTVIEDRPKFANNARRQGADEVICQPFETALSSIEGDDDTFFVIVTRGHRFDKDCLRVIARKPHAYIGMIGSRRRVAMVKNSLKEEGVPADVLDQVYTPIGLDIGAETPEEIGVSIIAEIIQVKNSTKRSVGFSRALLQALTEEDSTGKILATITARKGSAPREVGAKMLIQTDGSCIGTIGGGCAESDVVTYAKTRLSVSEKIAELYHVDMTQSDDAENDGMVCGGVIDVFLETI